MLRRWSHQPPKHEKYYPLGRLLVTVPRIFPPVNALVEPHEYFSNWKTFDEEAFTDMSGDNLEALLTRGACGCDDLVRAPSLTAALPL
jgi:hypothetical protein